VTIEKRLPDKQSRDIPIKRIIKKRLLPQNLNRPLGLDNDEIIQNCDNGFHVIKTYDIDINGPHGSKNPFAQYTYQTMFEI
jgi:hypothetical protein